MGTMNIQLRTPVTMGGMYYTFTGDEFDNTDEILLSDQDLRHMRDLINKELGVYQPTVVPPTPEKVTINDYVLSALISPLDLNLDEALRAYLVASGVVIK